MSMPPTTSVATKSTAPPTKSQKESRFTRGKATSLAPTMSGTTKLPSADGIPGMTKRKIITAPCSVNILL